MSDVTFIDLSSFTCDVCGKKRDTTMERGISGPIDEEKNKVTICAMCMTKAIYWAGINALGHSDLMKAAKVRNARYPDADEPLVVGVP